MQKGYVGTTNPDVNYKELEREQIVILKDLVEELRVEEERFDGSKSPQKLNGKNYKLYNGNSE